MKAVLFIVACFIAVSLAAPVEPENRVRRQNKERGKVDVDIHREKGVGTVVGAQAQGNIWTSRNGNTRLDGQAEWHRVFNGPGAGKPQYSGGITFTHKF